MPQQSINALDRRVYSAENDAISKAVVSSTEQNISVTDIISEGPIGGLVNGTASVFLNNDPMDSSTDAVYRNMATDIVLTQGSTAVQIALNGNVFTATTAPEVKRYLQVFGYKKIKVTAALSPSDMLNGKYYKIVARPSGGADFTTIGAPNNSIGTTFTARIGVTYPAVGQPGSTVWPNSFSGTGTVSLFGTNVDAEFVSAMGVAAVTSMTHRQHVGYKRVGSTPALDTAWGTAENLPDSFAITNNLTTIELDKGNGETLSGTRLNSINASTGYMEWFGPAFNTKQASSLIPADQVNAVRTIMVNIFLEIAKIENNTITLANAWTGATGTHKFGITAATEGSNPTNNSVESTSKYFKASCKVAIGTLEQEPLDTLEGTGSSSIAMTVGNANLEKFIPANNNYTTVTAVGLQASQIDEVKIIVQYPRGLYLQVDRSGSYYGAGVAYHLEIAVNTGIGTPVFKTIQPPASLTARTFIKNGVEIPVWLKTGIHKSKFTEEFRINLEGLQPYVGFTIRISRLTKHDSEDYTTGTVFGGDNRGGGGVAANLTTAKGGLSAKNSGGEQKHTTGVYDSTVTQALGIIKEKLNFPYTAYANTQFSSKTFQSSPTRSYECYGLKIKVPSNYITREENDGLNAKYTRVPGDVEALMNTPQLWDGAFRGITNENGVFEPLKVYTDNPAWVFYDICTNDRYGLGDYLKESDIDKFSLYKVAKYCDELVSDGKGGLEPRFRANLYLTKATDAYKILKDFATVFRGILYWTDGTFKAVMDSPSEPVYNFTRANVIDGSFEYQSTGSRTRTNQVVVTWNNPESEYKLEPIIVEDRENIIKTGVLKTEKAVAFGCTSEGQAIRYGRWKLWTAVNQKELVSFKTGVNAAFLAPGDVVNIQDEADFRVPFSGRLNSYSAAANTVTIDREVRAYFSSGYEYTIAIVIPTKSVILNQEVATIVNASGTPTTYFSGDIVTHATIGGATVQLLHDNPETTNKRVLSAIDTSGLPVSLQYIEETLIEERVLNSSSGGSSTSDGRDTIAFIGDDFLVAPTSGAIWAIKQKSATTGQTVAGSYKQFRILDIAESGPTEFDITAVEYYSDKFDAIDSEFLLSEPDPLYPREGVTTDVPTPRNLRILRTPNDELEGEELRLEWDAPSAEGASGAFLEYEHLQGYEIEHTFGSESGSNTIFIPASSPRSASFVKVPNGPHQVSVSTQSKTLRRSPKAMFNIEIDDIFEGNYPRVGGLIKGGYATKDITAPSSAGLVSFSGKSYVAAPFTAMQSGKRNTQADADSYSISCTALADVSWPADAEAYIMMDFSKISTAAPNANCLKVISRKRDSTSFDSNVDYWYDATKYVANPDSIWTSVGNVSVTNNSSKIDGSGFNSLKIPDVVTIGPPDYSAAGSGRDSAFTVVINDAGAADISVTAPGYGYRVNDTISVTDAKLGAGGGTTLTFDVATISPGKIGAIGNLTNATSSQRTEGTYTITENEWNSTGYGDNAIFSVVVSNNGTATVTLTDRGDDFLPYDIVSIADNKLGGGGGAVLTFQILTIVTGGGILTIDTVSSPSGDNRKAGTYSIGGGYAGKIALIASDTVMYLDRSWTEATAGGLMLKKQELDIDYLEDFLIAPISYNDTGAGFYSLGGSAAITSFLQITEESALRSRGVTVSSNVPLLNYSASASQTTSYSNISLSLGHINYEQPEYNVTGGGFSQLNTNADGANVFTAGNSSGELTKVIQTGNSAISYSATPIELIVKVREAQDPNNTDKQRTITYVISKVKDGIIGENGKVVFLSATDYSVIYDDTGLNPIFTGTGTPKNIIFTASTLGSFTDPLYRFTFAGGTPGAWTDTTNADDLQLAFTGGIPTSYNKTNWPKVVKVEAGEKPSGYQTGDAPSVISASDSTAIIGVKAGSGGVAVSNPNGAHTYTTDKNGNIIGHSNGVASIPNSSTSIELIVGGEVYTYAGGANTAHNYNAIADANIPEKGWYIYQAINTSSTGASDVTVGTPTGVVASVVTIGNHSTTSSTNADEIITWTINYRQGGVVKSIKTTQTLAKSIEGATGLNNATAEIYKLSASSGGATTKPLGDTIYTFAATGAKITFSSSGSNPSQGWTEEAPTPTTLTPYLYKRTGNASSNVATATIASSDWSPAILVVQPGAAGLNNATAEIWKLSNSAGGSTSRPLGNSTYDFAATGAKISFSNANGWAETAPNPTALLPYLYKRTAIASSNTTTATIATGDWSAGIIAGQPGLNQNTISLYYLNNDSSSAPTLINNSLYWNFAQKKLVASTGSTSDLGANDGSLDGWKQAFPATTDTLGVRWVTMAVASGNGLEDEIAYGDWSAPVVIGDDKSIKSHQVDLYQRDTDTTPPADPNTNLYWNFDNGNLVEGNNSTTNISDNHASLDGWTQDIPATGDKFIFKISAMALGNASATQDAIEPGDWSGAALISVPGEEGPVGKTLRITANQYYIKYRASGALITEGASSITFTANHNFASTPTFQWKIGTVVQSTTSSTYAYPKPSAYGNGIADVITCIATGGGVTVSDTQGVARLKEGVISAYLTNGNHDVPSTSGGVVTNAALAGAGGEMKVFDGITELTSGVVYAVSNEQGGDGDGGYADGLGMSLGSSTGVYYLTQIAAGWDSVNDWSKFTIRATISATGQYIEQVFSVVKKRQGADSPMKLTSYVYWQGAVATTDINSLQTTLTNLKNDLTASGNYSIGTQNNNASFNPDIGAGTPGTTYTGSGQSVKNWSTTPPEVNATRSVIFYAPYTITEIVTQGVGTNTGTVVFGTVAKGTSFSGLVTFAALADDLESGGTNNITQIDGGKITTKTIAADKLTIGETGRTTSRLLVLSDSVKIFDGQNLRVHLGNLTNSTT